MTRWYRLAMRALTLLVLIAPPAFAQVRELALEDEKLAIVKGDTKHSVRGGEVSVYRRAMRAALLIILASTPALAEPKPKKMDVAKLSAKAETIVARNAAGMTFVVFVSKDPGPKTGGSTIDERDKGAFFGKGTALNLLPARASSKDGADGWGFTFTAGGELRKEDGKIFLQCQGKKPVALTQLDDAAATKVLASATFSTPMPIYVPHVLGRDTRGTYYYIDHVGSEHGGGGHRLWIGKKGKLVSQPLEDALLDRGSELFIARKGDLRVQIEGDEVTVLRGDKQEPLKALDIVISAQMIHTELGVYPPAGIPCASVK